MKDVKRHNRIKQVILWPLLFLCVYGLIALEVRQQKMKGPARRTTYSTATGGYKVLYLWMQAMGVPVMRWENSVSDLEPGASVLLIAGPEIGPGTGELKTLEDWVLKGGTLILVIRPPNVFLEHFGLEIAVGDHEKDRDQTARFQPGYYTRGVRTIQAVNYSGLKSDRPGVVFHIRDKRGGLLAVIQEGKGRVIALADPSLFCNGSLKKGDHARLALNLLRIHHTEGPLLFDEYHHGYGRATSVFGHLGRSRVSEPLLQVILVVLMLWAARGRRFGPPRPLVEKEQRSSMHYVKAMAQLFERYRVRNLALESNIHWVEDEAKRLLLEKDRALQQTLSAVRQRLQNPEIKDHELLADVRGLYQALYRAQNKATGTGA